MKQLPQSAKTKNRMHLLNLDSLVETKPDPNKNIRKIIGCYVIMKLTSYITYLNFYSLRSAETLIHVCQTIKCCVIFYVACFYVRPCNYNYSLGHMFQINYMQFLLANHW